MKTCFVDTNVFLRLLKKDNLNQHKIAEKLFLDSVANKVDLKTTIVVIFEVYWVLKQFYKVGNEELQGYLLEILGLKVATLKKVLLRQAVMEMDKFGYDLEDAFNFYSAKEMEVDEFVSFDKKLVAKF